MLKRGSLSVVLATAVLVQSVASSSTVASVSGSPFSTQALSAFPIAAFRRPGDARAAFIVQQASDVAMENRSRRDFLRMIAILGLTPLVKPLAVFAQEPVQPLTYLSTWFQFFKPDITLKELQDYGNRLGELSIFTIWSDSKGHLVPASSFVDRALEQANRLSPRPRIYLTISNDRMGHKFDNKILRNWIKPGPQRVKHIQEILALSDKTDGIDLDYEGFKAGDGLLYPDFVRELAEALHERGKLLSVTMEPRTRLDSAHFIDWRALGGSVDRLRVMAYQFHGPKTAPGETSPSEEVLKLAHEALTLVPRDKLEIAIGIYGYDWVKRGGKRQRWYGKLVNTLESFLGLPRKKPSESDGELDPEIQSGNFNYVVRMGKRTVSHEVRYPDPASVADLIKKLGESGIGHIGLWQLSGRDLSDLIKLLDMGGKPEPKAPETPEVVPSDERPKLPMTPMAAMAMFVSPEHRIQGLLFKTDLYQHISIAISRYREEFSHYPLAAYRNLIDDFFFALPTGDALPTVIAPLQDLDEVWEAIVSTIGREKERKDPNWRWFIAKGMFNKMSNEMALETVKGFFRETLAEGDFAFLFDKLDRGTAERFDDLAQTYGLKKIYSDVSLPEGRIRQGAYRLDFPPAIVIYQKRARELLRNAA